MSAPPSSTPVFLHNPLYFAVCFLALWCLVSFVISVMSGWNALSRRFRCIGEFQGQKWWFRSAYMRFGAHFGAVLTVGCNRAGLYLAVFPLFRIGHPPLCIPWQEITVVPGDAGFFIPRRELLLGSEEHIPLRISLWLADDLKRAAGPAWPTDSPAA